MTSTRTTALWTYDARTLAGLIADREATAVDVVAAHLRRIADIDPVVNATTAVLADAALAEAEAVDRGEVRGPLAGVPFTVKNNLDLAGSPTDWGVGAFSALAIATEDAPAVAALRRAGAIPIARGNMPDFATRWHTDNDAAGPTVNPWDATRSPGGSSGGDAVAVATGMVPLGLGTDFGGSLRVPAAFCGVASLRTTPGAVAVASSLPGAAPAPTNQLFASPGPLARTIADLRLAFELMRDGDPRDPAWITVRDNADATMPAVAVTFDGGAGQVDPEVRDAIRRAADALTDAGYRVAELTPPQLTEATVAYGRLVSTEVVVQRRDTMRQVGSAGLNSFLDAALELFPPLDLPGYMSGLAERLPVRAAWSRFLADHPIVLGPVSAQLPWPVGYDLTGTEAVAEMYDAQRLTVAANYLALPSVTVPAGRSNDGLPIGVQLITSPFAEHRGLLAASHIENALGPASPIDPRS
ncbi:amidase family protein [Nocardia yamanashiensis]|uniref:amidase family protein n=1 Tax=Nocardia yamanashiensis TaxID=209247 RepID=UPI00083376DC|nr:amidase family protein [Nocardia yamanashiensis]